MSTVALEVRRRPEEVESPITANRLRVLFVAHSSQIGGAELCLDTTLRHLDLQRFEPVVIFPDDGPMADQTRRLGCRVFIRPMNHWIYFERNWWYWKNLVGRFIPNVISFVRLIRDQNIDLVYTNTCAIFESALAARMARVPHVWHVHEVLKNGNRMNQLLPLGLLKRIVYGLSDRVVFESNASRTVFEESTRSDRSKVVYNSLRLHNDDLTESANTSRARFGLNPSDQVIGFIGQLIDRKNPFLILRAMRRLTHLPKLVALFAGTGPLADELRSRSFEWGLQDRCRFVDRQEDVRPCLNAVDVLVLPSRQESFGLVLLEAAHFGKPAIACSSEGPSEIIVDGKTGFLIPQNDDQALAAKLGLLFASDGDRVSMGQAAQIHVHNNFSADANTRLLESILAEMSDPR